MYEAELGTPEGVDMRPVHTAALSVTSGKAEMGREKAGSAGFSCVNF